jgi:hypothetical protein
MSNTNSNRFIALFLLAVLWAAPLRAEIIFEHTGNADPVTEGWTASNAGGGGQVVGPLTNDAGSGLDAWSMSDTSTALFTTLSYNQTPTPAQLNQASTLGWSYSVTIRIPNSSDLAAASPFVSYRDGSRNWQMGFGSEADGDPIVLLFDGGGSHPNFTGPSYTLQGAGSTYRTYDLVFDPVADSADLFIDGVERISNFPGYALAATTFGFGNGSSADTGQGNFNSVQFFVVPEPASALLCGSGVVVAGIFGYLRRRKTRAA